jgi:hypothetical protein
LLAKALLAKASSVLAAFAGAEGLESDEGPCQSLAKATQWFNKPLSLPKPCQSLAKATPWFNKPLSLPKPCQSIAKA